MFQSPHLQHAHGFSTTLEGDFVGPSRAMVEAALVARLGGQGPLHTLRQVHGRQVVWVGEGGHEGDALISTQPHTVIAMRVADCVPILVEGPQVVAAIHAGWRGTAADIVRETIQAITQRLGIVPTQLRAVVGPCIGQSCYEVSPEVLSALAQVAVDNTWQEGRQADLGVLNLRILQELGVDAQRLDICTRCTPSLWSHRRGDTGRQVGAICL